MSLFFNICTTLWRTATIILCLSTGAIIHAQTLIAHFPMDLNASKNSIKEVIYNQNYLVNDHRNNAENVQGIDGLALRFNGFSNFVDAKIKVSSLNSQALSMSIRVAMENYPMMDIDGYLYEMTSIAGNLNDDNKEGFAFVMNARGQYGFEVYIKRTKVQCYASEPFPQFEWVDMQATVDNTAQECKLWVNGELVNTVSYTQGLINYPVNDASGNAAFLIGKDWKTNIFHEENSQNYSMMSGPFYLNTINGVIDDIKIYNGVLPAPESSPVGRQADLNIPPSRFAGDIQRPVFHGMPAANWTNEPHGLIWHNNLWHLFFQKNANGAYWGRLHWGHIISEDLVHWTETKPALEPDMPYDIKGNWTGCIFQDDELTGGVPHIFYTAVNWQKASIVEVAPKDGDDNLMEWIKPAKNAEPIIPQCPPGFPEDFRDPFVFKAHGKYWMIVGSSKDGKGACTLHEYNPATKTWSNDGRAFYQGSSTQWGTFWEVPVLVQMQNGKWLLTATPLYIPASGDGTQVFYWVGDVNPDGTFTPISHSPKQLELDNMSKLGYGLLCHTVWNKKGKIILTGVVPDKLSGERNFEFGWAHTFCLPRELSLDANNELCQKPAEELLSALRKGANNYSQSNFTLNSETLLLPDINGYTAELEATFVVSGNATQRFGFNVRKNGNNRIEIYYNPNTHNFTVDATNCTRISNDWDNYNGFYESNIPQAFVAGDTVKMHIFLDHSIMDIFINDRWAFSWRVFPTDATATGIEIFSEGATVIRSLNAYKINYVPKTLNNENVLPTLPTLADIPKADVFCNGKKIVINSSQKERVSIYTIFGQQVYSGTKDAGEKVVSLPDISRQILIVVGHSGWSKKIFACV
jgi:beta-fructofuranosidase